MDDYAPPRGTRWAVATAIPALLIGVAAHWAFAVRIDRRIAEGVRVPAEVTRVQRLPLGKTYQPQRVTVTYDRDGVREARLVSALDEGGYRVGERLTVFVDPADPAGVATAEGFASEGLFLLMPPAVIFYGALAGLLVAIRRGRWWWRHERRAPGSVALLTVTGGRADEAILAWGWAAEGRRLADAAAAVSAGRSGPLRLLIYLRVGARGKPRVAYYSRRSRRLVVIGAAGFSDGGDPREVLRETIAACVATAERWNARRRRPADLSSLTEAVLALDSDQERE